jgi:mediator of RNA polymerase II transcription subunit 13
MLATSASPIVMITVIMSVDPTPAISVFRDQFPLLAKLGGQTASASTPADTPRSGVSPDAVLTPAATPAPDLGPDISNDPDAHLVDIGDETWGLILGHRTNITNSIVDYRPSLSTGFLLKSNAAGMTSLDEPEDAQLKDLILIGVKLVWIGSSPKPPQAAQPQPNIQQQMSPAPLQSAFSNLPGIPLIDATSSAGLMTMPPAVPATTTPTSTQQHPQQLGVLNTSTSGNSIPKVTADSILRDYLQMYRNLGVLARARGLRATKRGALPWHVVVAMRAAEALESSYGTMQTNS